MRLLTFLMLLFSLTAYAQESQPTPAAPACPPATACPECPKCETRGKTEGYRDDSTGTVMVGYQYLNTWVVGKTAASYTHNIGRHWGLEFEFATSKRNVEIADFELGEIQEDRYTLLLKYFVGNSFHFSTGPFMYDVQMDTNNKLTDVSGGRVSDSWELEGYGLAFAFGNRWQNKWGLTWGVDWIRMNVPLLDGKIQRRNISRLDEQEEVKRTFNILRRIPGFTFVAVNVGYTF